MAKAAFDAVDADGSGYIDYTELRQVLANVSAECGAPPPTTTDVLDLMSELDTDGNGQIDLEEFEVLIRKQLSMTTEPEPFEEQDEEEEVQEQQIEEQEEEQVIEEEEEVIEQ